MIQSPVETVQNQSAAEMEQADIVNKNKRYRRPKRKFISYQKL
jgi:hypothetical protein